MGESTANIALAARALTAATAGQEARVPTVVVVSYRRADILRECLDSLREHLPAWPVIVWDNQSEGSVMIRELSKGYPEVEWIFSARNVGFAAAVNACVRRCPGNFLLLNPDARLIGDPSSMLGLLRQPRVAAVAPLSEGSGAVWDIARRRPTAFRYLVSASGYGRQLRRLPISDLYPSPPRNKMGYLVGCCLLIDRNAWERIGEFDEDFFLYAEEADWALRAIKAGYDFRLLSKVLVAHAAQGTVSDSNQARQLSDGFLHDSCARLLAKHYGRRSVLVYRYGLLLLRRVQRSKRGQPTPAGAVWEQPRRLLTCGESERRRYSSTLFWRASSGSVATGRVKTIHIGPSLKARGGMSSVQSLIVQASCGNVNIRHIPSAVDGRFTAKAVVLAAALVRLMFSRRLGPDIIVHLHVASRGSTLRKLIIAALARRLFKGVVLHAHGAEFVHFYEGLPRGAKRWVRQGFQKADRVIVLSSQWRSFFVQTLDVESERVVVLHNPVKLPVWTRDRSQSDVIRIVFLGRIGERKGAFDLVAAFKLLPDIVQRRATLVLAGDGEVERLALATSGATNVEVLGWVDAEQREKLLCSGDIIALPSRNEGLPMAVLEGMAHGLAVLATPVGGVPDLVRHGVEGMLTSPGDVIGLARTLSELVMDDDLRLRLAAAGRKRVASLDIDEYMKQLEHLYEGILAG